MFPYFKTCSWCWQLGVCQPLWCQQDWSFIFFIVKVTEDVKWLTVQRASHHWEAIEREKLRRVQWPPSPRGGHRTACRLTVMGERSSNTCCDVFQLLTWGYLWQKLGILKRGVKLLLPRLIKPVFFMPESLFLDSCCPYADLHGLYFQINNFYLEMLLYCNNNYLKMKCYRSIHSKESPLTT